MLLRSTTFFACVLVTTVAGSALALDTTPDEEPSPLPIYDPDLTPQPDAPGEPVIVDVTVAGDHEAASASAATQRDEADEGKRERRRRAR